MLLRLFFGSRASPPSPPLTKIPEENSNRISGTFKLCARKCLDNIEGHLQRFSDSYISQLWYYRFFFYPTDIHYRPFICHCRIRVENALKTHVKRISFPTRISKIQSKPTIDTR